MMSKYKQSLLAILLLCSISVFATDAVKTEPSFLDKATELTNKAIDGSKKVAKDVINKTTDVTNKVIDKSKVVGAKVVDEATALTNKVVSPKQDDEKKSCGCGK